MEVVWEQRGESQGSLWEMVAFEPDLRGWVEKSPSNESGCGYSGRGNGCLRRQLGPMLKGHLKPGQGTARQSVGARNADICLSFRKLSLAAE